MEEAKVDLDVLWQQALSLSPAPEKKGRSYKPQTAQPQLHSPDDLAAYIESRGAAFKDFRAKHGRLWSTLEKFITPVSAMIGIANTAATIANVSAASTAVLNAVAFLVQACEGVSSAYDWIEQVFRTEMQGFIDRLAQYTDVKLDHILQRKIVSIMGVMFKLIKRSDYLIRKGRFRQYLNVAFLGKDSETKALIDDLEQELDGEQRYVLAATFASTKKTQEATNKILSEAAQAKADAALKSALCATSAAEDVEATFYRASKALVQGSGGWLHEESAYKQWLAGQNRLLWLFGGPGAGKTHLSAWLIKQLMEDGQSAAEGFSVSYFFVKEDSEALRDVNTMLKTLAWQIAQQDADYKSYAASVCEKKTMTITYDETWQNLFLGYFNTSLSSPRPVTIVIDGLDEANAESRRALLRLLLPLTKSGITSSIQVAVISRPSLKGDTDRDMFKSGCIIEVSRGKTKRDINQYVKERLEDVRLLRTMRKIKPDGLKKANKLGSLILKRVSEGADGVFLWAKLLLDSIINKDQKQIEMAITNAPSSLDDMIWSVFRRMDDDGDLDHDVVRKIIHLVTYAREPLTFKDIYTNVVLPDLTPNYLLWDQMSGAMSSIIDMKLPSWYRLLPEDQADDRSSDARESESDNSEGFNFIEDDSELDLRTINDNSDGFGSLTYEALKTSKLDAGTADNASHSSSRRASVSSNLSSVSDGSDHKVRINHLAWLGLERQNAVITFCHAWIRDFIVREGRSGTIEKATLGVIPSAKDAQIDMTLACLSAYQVMTKVNAHHRRDLTNYAVANICYHLDAIDRSTAPRHKMMELLRGLHFLFGTHEGAKHFLKSVKLVSYGFRNEFWQCWVSTMDNLKLVQDFLREADNALYAGAFDGTVLQWMCDASTSIPFLLKVPMMVASRLWLVRSSLHAKGYLGRGDFPAWLMHGWLCMIEGNTDDPVLRNWGNWERSGHFNLLPEERIERLAHWAGLEKTEHWHTCLGEVLAEGDYDINAIAHFKMALELNSMNWVALRCMAFSFAAQKDFKAAIEWIRRAGDAVPEEHEDLMIGIWQYVSIWSAEIKDTEACKESALRSLRLRDHYDYPNVEIFASTLNEIHAYDTILEGLASLGYINRYNTTRLEFFLRECSWGNVTLIGPACRARGRPQFVLDAMDGAQTWALAAKYPSPDLEQRYLPTLGLARLYRLYYGLQEPALLLYEAFWNGVAQLVDTFDEDAEYFHAKHVGASELALLYFDIMVKSRNEKPDERPPFEANLKSVAISDRALPDGYYHYDLFMKEYAAMLWGRWLRAYANATDHVWRKCFRARLLEQIGLLRGETTAYFLALHSLARILFHAGDRSNAGIILTNLFLEHQASIFPTGEDLENPIPRGEQTRDRMEGVSMYGSSNKISHFICRGCRVESPEGREVHVCEICYDCAWCGQCLAVLRDPDTTRRFSLLLHACNPDHEFYRAWPISEEAKLTMMHAFEDDGTTIREEWLDNLRKEWTITT